MIDVTQLTSLISAFRVETEKESISPETVGKLLQDITDLLANASTDAERQILDDWKAMLSQYTVVYDVAHATGMSDMQTMFLTLRGRSLRNGATFTSSVPLSAATDMQAGVMSATHVQTIMALQTAASQLRSNVSSLQTLTGQHSQMLYIIQAAGYVVTGISQGNGHSSKINLAIYKHDVRTGEDFVFDAGCTINGATAQQAGAMTAAQVQSLTNAKSDITALQAAVRKIVGADIVVTGAQVCHIATDKVGIQLFGYDLATGEREIEFQNFYLTAASQYGAGVMTAQHVKQLNALREAVFGGSGTAGLHSFYNFGIEIGMGKDELRLNGANALLALGYVPYLFRYSRKRNRKTDQQGIKGHGDIRKGWNVVGKRETIRIMNNGLVTIDKVMFVHDEFDDEEMQNMEQFQSEAKFFLADKLDQTMDIRYVPFGKTRIDIQVKKNGEYQYRKLRLKYGIAFAPYRIGGRELLDKNNLVTPIVPFHVATVLRDGSYRWVFEK